MFGFAGNSDQALKDRMKSDLDFIRNTFEVCYAPKEWKQSYAGWELDSSIQQTKDKIDNTTGITVKQYQRIVNEFFNSTKDYHTGVYFWSTESAMLPFSVRTAEGRYFISYVDYSKMNQSVYPVNIGDELVTFDNKPSDEVVRDLMGSVTKQANTATDNELAAFFLTHRMGALGHSVPKGPIMIGIKSAGSDKVRQFQLMWTYTPEKVKNGFKGSLAEKDDEEKNSIFAKKNWYDKMMIMPQFEAISKMYKKAKHDVDNEGDNDQERFLGSRKSFIPQLGLRQWWESDAQCPYHAYMYETPDHKMIGYVRIPHYSGFETQTFASIMSLFQDRTDALIIDQVDNPGGNLLYLYGLLSTLTDQPLIVPTERMMITHEEVVNAVSIIPDLEKISSDEQAQQMLGPEICGMPITYQAAQFFLDYFNFIVNEWNDGRKFTNPYPILGIDRVLPHPYVRYTKPILVLTNSLDLSCGDFFPAIMQDNKRATIMGARTAGAGGYVLSTMYPNKFGIIGFTYTGSIAERLDKNPIENLGVTPDIEYTFTADDLQNNYQGYVDAINTAVTNMLNPVNTPQ